MVEALLRDRRVLVVEDEYMLADTMERGLRKAGATVLGPVPSVAQALALLAAEPDIDAAVLDINLDGERVFPVADALAARGVPFLFTTGYDASDLPAAYAGVTRCGKPVDVAAVVRALAADQPDARSGRIAAA